MTFNRLCVVALSAASLLPAQQSAADAFSSAVERNRAQTANPNAGTGIPAGTPITVKIVDDIDSERDAVGRTFPAMLDDAVVANGKTILDRGADATVRLVEDPKANQSKEGPILKLELVDIVVNGRNISATSSSVALCTTPRAVPSQQPAAAAKPSGSSTFGALLSALSGTDQGAEYMGTVTGSTSAGVAKTWVTGPRVRLNEETRLTFVLSNPVRF